MEVSGGENPDSHPGLGSAGVEFGIALYQGEDALVPLAPFERDVITGEELADSVTFATVAGSRLDEIPSRLRGVLNRAGFTGRRESLAPVFMYNVPGHRPRVPGNP